MRPLALALPVLAALSGGAASAAPFMGDAEAGDLIRRIVDLDGKCRGGAGDEQATMEACDVRDSAMKRVNAAGWCYGRYGEIGADHEWHRCTPVSFGSPFALPMLNPERKCEAEWTRGGATDFQMFRWCLRQEQAAYGHLKRAWGEASPDTRAVCERDWGGYNGSYQMLAWCAVQQETAEREARQTPNFRW